MVSFVKILIFLAGFIEYISCHSWLAEPPGRRVGVANPADGGSCPNVAKVGEKLPVYERGQQVPAKWPRNNHPGGFVRWSIVPFSEDRNPDGFDDPQNIFQVSCFQTDCSGIGGDPFAVGLSDCSSSFTLPSRLKDGKYTMQWMWTQGAHNKHGKINKDYVSCLDLEIRGGSSLDVVNGTTCKFIEGDIFGQKGCMAVSRTTDELIANQIPSFNLKCEKGPSSLNVPSSSFSSSSQIAPKTNESVEKTLTKSDVNSDPKEQRKQERRLRRERRRLRRGREKKEFKKF